MPDRLPCEFALIRYVPDVVKGEFVNIGVLLRPAGAPAAATVLRFTRDWARVRCMDTEADIALFEALEAEIADRLRLGDADTKPVLQLLEDTLSNSLQISEPRAVLADNLADELDQLMRLYVEPIRVRHDRRRTGRAALQAALRTEFERAGVWSMMRRRIAASTYTRPGDPMKLDCGYKAIAHRNEAEGTPPDGLIRIFQTVSLEGDIEGAKGLAWAAPRLREGVRRVEQTDLELTAIVEPLRSLSIGREDNERDDDAVATESNEATDRYRFGVEAMEREAIRVITIADLARAAETARHELGL
ncbi:MAG: DUF3037 domain-containing protein [Edaphobacter sp.]|uniref:DUF3037 domain-containing protein n=1 Tax=Edaphobacter sp. TaxID=1934404 RepID=UPI00239396E7|nr:DUF3037 domain-containing protein [Edaphobacter sp.]MDE1176720.1 DUF3037 domain-containing protein [Edaphobacter sp.]